MAKVYQFMGNGFEDIEAVAVVDILRRGGIDIKTVSVTGSEYVQTAHGMTLKTDMMFEESDFSDADLLMLPGGMAPGAASLNEHEGLTGLIVEHYNRGGKIAAICAAPFIFGRLGLLRGKRATCYPGFETYLEGAEYTAAPVTVDGNIITGKGPGATLIYALEILRQLTDATNADKVAKAMCYI